MTIGALVLLAGSAIAEAKGETHGLRPVAGLVSPGAGYGSPHGSTRVRTVQHLLQRAGEHPGPVDGRYGPLTEAAVERFQAREGLAVDGVVGPATRPALTRAAALVAPGTGYRSPEGSTRVRTVQHLLQQAGEHPGPVDGRYGPLTEAAVERFQAREGLAVDGVVGLATRAGLERSTAPSSGRSRHPITRATPRETGPEALPRPTEGGFPEWLIGVAIGAGLLLAATIGFAARTGRRKRDGPAIDVQPFQVRIHGRHGRGVMTAAELLSVAALAEGRQALAFPSLRPRAMGSQVVALCRIGGGSIRPREPIGHPDGLIVEDPAVLHLNGNGLKRLGPDGYLLVNSTKRIEELDLGLLAAGLRRERRLTLPATELACGALGLSRPDTALVGGFVALTGVVSLTSLLRSIRERFRGPSGEANVDAAEAGFAYVVGVLSELASPLELDLPREEVQAQKRPA
jgi:pyruvate ferredoxin oxidoreductase gamma subunit